MGWTLRTGEECRGLSGDTTLRCPPSTNALRPGQRFPSSGAHPGSSPRWGLRCSYPALTAPLAAGLYVFSNGPPSQQWPKQRRLRAAYIAATNPPDISANTLLELLQDETPAAEQELPDTGIGPVRERLLSPIFIRGDIYGTRASTLFRLAGDGSCKLIECSFAANGMQEAEQRWNLASPHAAWQPG